MDDEVKDDILDTEHLPGEKNALHLEGGWDYLEVMIKDVLPGDEVLSLNEETEEFEYQRVEKLLDMGRKGVYELTTLSGRTIKTTGNHPYLTRLTSKESKPTFEVVYQSPIDDAGWVKVSNLKVGDKIAVLEDLMPGAAGFFAKHIPDYSQSNNSNAKSYLSQGNLWGQVNHTSSNISSVATASFQEMIANRMFPVNIIGSLEANMAINQAATKLEQTAEKTFSWAVVGSKENLISQNTTTRGNTYQWDEIVSIRYIGYEHVYDLQIANTHNFVGNDIVAHNTYISGNVGIGFTSPDRSLQIAGDITTSSPTIASLLGPAGSQLGISGSSSNTLNKKLVFGLDTTNNYGFIQAGANLGVGNSANYNLSLNPVGGNVGIGFTSPAYSLDVYGTGRFRDLITHDLILANGSNANILQGYAGYSGYTSVTGGLGTGGVDSITPSQRITNTGNLVNIGSIQAGETLLTSAGTFNAKVDYATGTNPYGVAIGDLNGDGKADLATANSNSISNTVSVFTNKGDGTFNATVNYGTGSNPLGVAIGDVNGDGKADLAVTNSGSDTVSVLTNQGNGTFNAKVDYTAGSYPFNIAIGDLNGDGKADLAVANRYSYTVSVFTNKGDGTFNTKVDYTTGTDPRSVAIGDLNGDGKADLAVANYEGPTVSVFINKGDGRFNAKVDYGTGTNPFSVAIGDLNGDGKADLAAANWGSDTVSVLTNKGDGTFNTKVDYGTGTDPYSVAIGDVNGDGKADLAVTNSGGTTVSVFINKGDGRFNARVDYTTGTTPRGVAIGDLNGDGKADLAVANTVTNTVSVLTNKTTTIFYANALTGNVGIGTSANMTTNNLSVFGGVGIGNSGPNGFSNSLAPSLGLAIQGNVGIGTSTATNNLTVIGSASIGSNYGGYTAPTDGLIIQGNVGIGTSNGTPSYALSVNGSIDLTTLSNQILINGQNALSFPGTNGSFTNIGIGRSAGGSLTSGINNVFIGDRAGMNNTTSSSNIFIGIQAGQNTTASNNTFVGYQAGQNTTTADANAFFGYQAGQSNTSGNYNSYFGTSSGTSNTTGRYNSFFGNQSGVNNTNEFNSFFGAQSGQSNTTGNSNSFFGTSSGASNTSGSLNAFFGASSGQYNTGGIENSFFGAQSGQSNTGSDNAFFGYKSGMVNAGSNNAFFGVYSGVNNTSGGTNAFFGKDSGYSNVSGSSNVFLGYQAGYYEKGSNKLYIANSSTNRPLLYGDFSAGNIGIGVTAGTGLVPAARLQLQGAGTGTGRVLMTQDLNQTSFGLAVLDNGNVGIGTTSPAGALHVVGQCVAKGTRIRRRRRKKASHSSDGDPKGLLGRWDEQDWEDIPVEDIKSGDEVLSLNDVTGQWEWNKVEATLNKGVQTVYRLETEGGKWIETRMEVATFPSSVIARSGNDHDVAIHKTDSHGRQGDLGMTIQWEKIVSINKVGRKQTYDLQIANTHNFVGGHYINRKTGKALSQEQEEAYVQYLHQKTILSDGSLGALAGLEPVRSTNFGGSTDSGNSSPSSSSNITQQNQDVNNDLNGSGPKGNRTPGTMLEGLAPRPAGPTPLSLSDILGLAVKETLDTSKVGFDSFEVELGFDPDDIEYGGIVAHNTYINGSAGLGVNFVNTTTPANGLAIQGNVGIGTTTADYNLSVIGTGNFTGNVGVGQSLTVTGTGTIGVFDRLKVNTLADVSALNATTVNASTLSLSSTLSLADGSAATPGLNFTNDTDSGLWRVGTNLVGLTTNGSGALQSKATINGLSVDASGNVGIGITNPAQRLHISGNLQLGEPGNGAKTLYFSNGNPSGEVAVLAISAANVVTLSSADALNISANPIRTSNGVIINRTASNPSNALDVYGAAVIGTSYTSTYTAPTNGLLVEGNVGIGVTTVNAKLQVNGGTLLGYGLNAAAGAPTNGLAVNGNVGIGTTSPITQLHIPGTVPTSSTSTVSGTANSVYVQGRYAYVTNNSSGFKIIDISNPKSPITISTVSSSNLDYSVAISVQGRYAYVLSNGVGGKSNLVVFDVSNPTNPTQLNYPSNFLIYTNPSSMYVQGKYAYVGTQTNTGFYIIDISNPSNPVVAYQSGSFGTNTSVFVQGGYAYLGSDAGTLRIIDVSNAASSTLVGSTTSGVSGAIYGVYVSGRYAYVTSNSNNSLSIFDVSNAASPTNVGSTSTSLSSPRGIFVQGRYAYVTSNSNNSLVVFDVSSPSTPINVGSVTSSSPQSVFVQGRYAYAGGGNFGIFDLGGAYIQQLETGGIETSTLGVTSNAIIGNDLNIVGGLSVGRGAEITGPVSFLSNSLAGGVFSFSSGGNIGIGNTNGGFNYGSPYSRLTLQGAGTGLTFSTVNSTLSQFGLAVLDNGNVGVGTTNPAYNFQVAGTGNFGNLGIGGSLVVSGNVGVGQSLSVTNNLNVGAGLKVTGYADLTGNVGIGQSLTVTGASTIGVFDRLKVNTLADVAALNVSGNIGVGGSITGYGALNGLNVTGLSNLAGLNVNGAAALSSTLSVAGVSSFANGSASAPSITFTSDTDTGLFRLTTNTLSLTTAGTSRLTVDGAGNVGIGYTSPAAFLHILNTGTGTSFRVDDIANDTTPFIIDAAGNVGIGTTSPGGTLHVSGNTIILGAGEGGTPTATTIRGAAASGSDILGANLTFDASNGTGAGGSGAIIFRTAGPLSATNPSVYENSSTYTTSTDAGAGATSHSFTSHSIGSNLNRLVIVGISYRTNTSVSSVTFGGTAMTYLTNSRVNASDRSTELWYLVNPPTGQSTVAVTFPVNEVSTVISANSFYNVHQSTPLGTAATNSGTSTSATVAVSSATTELVFGILSNYSDVPSTSSPATQRFQAATNLAWIRSTGATNTGASSITITWTNATTISAWWSSSGVSVKPAVSADINLLAERLRITNTGNVGIGFTSPTALLDVMGTTLLRGSSTTTGLAVTAAGNVGVGTTSPAGALHVVGQCVAEGTRIRRRRRKKASHSSDGDPKGLLGRWDEQDWEEVPVEDIVAGDEVLSLNDQTGQWEWHKVEKTMDMGIQEVLKLVTQTGKIIETTDEHPYLTITEDTKDDQKSQRLTTFEVDQSIRVEDKTADTILAIANIESSFITKLDKKQKQILFKKYSQNNQSKKFGFEIFAQMVVASIIKSGLTVTDLVIDIEYNKHEMDIAAIIRKSFPKMGIYFKSIGKHSPAHLAAYTTHIQRNLKKSKKEETLANLKLKGFLASELLHPEFTGIRSPHGLFTISNYTTKWEKIKYLKPGMLIATVDGWEKISTIYLAGRIKTFDLQIEGTHNFVGNNIVAHNTYINGSTGLGVNFVNTTTPTNGLAIQGNVGIGTTTANSKLVVVGNANIGSAYSGVTTPANGLLVQGNVGIGTTGLGGNGAFNLDVWGTARITGNTTINGVLTTSGNIGVGGSITGFGALNGLNVTGLTNLAGLNASGNVGIGGTLTLSSNLNISGNIIPSSDDTYDLGSNTARFKDLYLGPATLHLGTSTSDEYTLSYDTTANSLGFNVNGAGPAEITFDSSGNVGIGFTSPTALLQVNSGSSAFTVSSTGNVGVGGSLTITSLITANAGISLPAGQTISLGNFTSGGALFAGSNGLISQNVSDYYWDNTNNRLGIGTSSPNSALSVIGNVGIGTSAAGARLQANGGAIFWPTTASLSLASGTSLATNGNIGIGTTTADYNLSVIGTGNFTGNLGVGGSLTTTGLTVANGGLNVSGLSNLTGNVGIGQSLTVTSAAVFNSGIKVSGAADLTSINLNGDTITDLTGTNLTVSSGALSVASSPTLTGLTLNLGSDATGDILYRNSGGTLSRLGIGSVDQVLTVSAGLPAWAASQSGASSQWTTSAPNIYFLGTTGSGNVGIGDTYANYSKLQLTGSGTGTDITFQTLDSSGTQRFTILDNGNVGVGTTAPAYNFQVSGTGNFGNLGVGGSLVVSGNLGVGGSITGYGALSGLNVTGLTNLAALNATTVNASTLSLSSTLSVAGVSSFANGSASAPSITFTSDTDSGLWRIGANQIALTTAGGSHSGLSINSAGNVGVGTTSAGQLFQVGSNIVTPSLSVTSAGNVGIGTSGPAAALDISGTTPSLRITDTSYAPPPTSTGGTITQSGGYTIHTFTSSGTFTPSAAMNVEVMVVGGGGGGASGGGGAGGYRTNNAYAVSVQAYTVTVGGGGSGQQENTAGSDGSASVFDTISAAGGGGAGPNAAAPTGNGRSGGSGGGAGAAASATTGGAGNTPSTSPSQGNNGGANDIGAPTYPSGGGGGSGGTGGNASAGVAGAGGAGTANSISGSSVTYAAGGAGALYNSGGNGAAGTANRGNGGNGAQDTYTGGNGGSGIVIIRYLTNNISPITLLGTNSGGIFDLRNSTAAAGSLLNLDLSNTRIGIGTSAPQQLFQVNQANTPFVVTSSGNIGIGTTSPSQLLQINPGLTLAGSEMVFTSSGNLGIGTTTPGARLVVAGGVGIGVSYTNSSIPSNGLAIQGNLGVGTTTPLGALHVVGQCVAEGTLIKRRRRRRKTMDDGEIEDGG
ncbi:VCBS repeat-containing protein [Candidatus Daviesbacteria bacterium]|nr:VCBS repeat-containing protein [Candidatus Daviesbacteria bacterium]